MRFVVAHSGLAHLLLKDLAGVFRAKSHTRVAALKRADLIAGVISSALACEYLVGNRYYRNLPTVLASQEHVVGVSNATAPTTPNDATYNKIQETGEALQALYDANIDRLEWCVDQYEQGVVSLNTLRTDPGFVKMFSEFWKLGFQTMKARALSETRIAAARAANPANLSAFSCDAESAERILICRQILKGQCCFSRLYQYRIAHLFDNSNFNYATLVRSAKSTQLRLCNDGLTVALLTFAAIEPRMASAKLVPKLGQRYLTCDVSGAANHVQSRDTVFGHLMVKYRQHVPRANEVYTKRRGGISLDPLRASKAYKPVQAILESIQSGRRCVVKRERYCGR
jgi:hypothetical protein